jgi:hypothetical protein
MPRRKRNKKRWEKEGEGRRAEEKKRGRRERRMRGGKEAPTLYK